MPPILRPAIIDVESSGFGPDSYPIEIGVALAMGKRYSALIKPLDKWTYWDAEAEATHGISRDKLRVYGRPVRQVAEELNQMLGEQTVYSDGWVVDAPWIDKLFFYASMSRRFRVSPLEGILSEPQMDIWHTTKDDFLSSNKINRHRASTDAMVIQETFVRTRLLTIAQPGAV